MNIKQLFPNTGDQADIARILGVTPPVVCKWWRRGYLPIEQALVLERAFNIPAESMIKPSLARLLGSRPNKRKIMKTKEAGVVIDDGQSNAYWARVRKVTAVPDTFELTISSQYKGAKSPDATQVKAQLFLSEAGLNTLAKAIFNELAVVKGGAAD